MGAFWITLLAELLLIVLIVVDLIMENEGTKADTKARNIFELVLVIVLTIFNMLLTLNGQIMEKKIKDLTIQECRKICLDKRTKYHSCEKCPLVLLDSQKYYYCSIQHVFHLSKYALNKKVKVD